MVRVSEEHGGLGCQGAWWVPGSWVRVQVGAWGQLVLWGQQESNQQPPKLPKGFSPISFLLCWGFWLVFWYVLPLLEEEEQYDNILIEERKIISNRGC